jgi:hypothetical protein
MVVTAILMSVTISVFLMQSGNRRIIGTMYGSALMCWMLQHGRQLQFRHLVVALFGVGGLLVLMQVMIEYRSAGFGRALRGEGQIELETVRIDDNFLRLCQIIELVPARFDHVEEKQFVWTIIRPVPRVLWPGKPLSPGFDLGEVVGLRGTSLTSSVIGEFYLSYGWPMVALGGLFYGLLAGACSRLLTLSDRPARLIIYGLSAIAIFAGLRSMIELVLMSYTVLAWVGLSVILGFNKSESGGVYSSAEL